MSDELQRQIDDLAGRLGAIEKVLNARVEYKNSSSSSMRDMTRDDARRILVGDLKDLKHGEAGEILGLTYAQVYSCRGGYTFKDVRRELERANVQIPWKGRT